MRGIREDRGVRRQAEDVDETYRTLVFGVADV